MSKATGQDHAIETIKPFCGVPHKLGLVTQSLNGSFAVAEPTVAEICDLCLACDRASA